MASKKSKTRRSLKESFRSLLRLNKPDKEEVCGKPLLLGIIERDTHTTTGRQICNTEITDQSKHSDKISSTDHVNGDKVLNVLREILNADSNPEDLKDAEMIMNKWGQQNCISMESNKNMYPQDWLWEFLQLIDESVEKHFCTLPEDETNTSEQLQQLENMMCSEVCRLTPVLKDAGLLGCLTDTYSHRLFIRLDQMTRRSSCKKKDFLSLLLWGKRIFLSPDLKDVFSVYDPLVFTGWFEEAKQKLLDEQRTEIHGHFQNILCNEEPDADKEGSMSEEWFNSIHIDIIQYMDATEKEAKIFSLTFMNSTQNLFLEELQRFAHGYEDKLKKQEEFKFVYLCKIISTCMKLGCLVIQKDNEDKYKSAETFKMLKDRVLSIVKKKIKDLAQVKIKSSFKNGDQHIYDLMKEIQDDCESLPQTESADEIKTMIVKLAYNCVSRVYLDHLTKSKWKNLERRWENVQERIEKDVQIFQDEFAQLNGSEEHEDLLQRMTEVLFCADVEALKIICATLFRDFPKESELYLPRLLHWNKTLSKPQVTEILDVVPDAETRILHVTTGFSPKVPHWNCCGGS